MDKPSELTREVCNISPVITHAGTTLGPLLRERKAAGMITTFYVCMQPAVPNTYTTSAPAESEWLGFFAAANHLDGFLRWAYNAWNRNPLETTDFGNWSTGESEAAAAIVDSMNARLAALFTVECSTMRSHAQDILEAHSIISETLSALNALQR